MVPVALVRALVFVVVVVVVAVVVGGLTPVVKPLTMYRLVRLPANDVLNQHWPQPKLQWVHVWRKWQRVQHSPGPAARVLGAPGW